MPKVDKSDNINDILNTAKGEEISTSVRVAPNVFMGSLRRLSKGAIAEIIKVIPARITDIVKPQSAIRIKTLKKENRVRIAVLRQIRSKSRLIPPIIIERCKPETTIT